jgi:hypothetical protein
VLSFSYFLVRLPKVYKSIFTSPSSAADDCESESENEAPLKAAKLSQSRKKVTKRNVASKLHMNDKVTPRSIAYAAVQVFDSMHFVRIPTHVYLYSSFTSICRPLSDGTKFTEDSITVVFTTTSLTFSKTYKRALRRNVHRTYLSGGLCKSTFHGLERSLTYVCLVEKSSQLPPLASSPALLLLARL